MTTSIRMGFICVPSLRVAVDQIAWDILTSLECAGMGGVITIPVPPYTDPLPDPLPQE